MYENLLIWLFSPPKRATDIGKGLFSAGSLLLVTGLIARLGPVALNAISRMQGKGASPPTLAELYPQLPTWFIPEGWLGYSVAVLLIVTGLVLISWARKMWRVYF